MAVIARGPVFAGGFETVPVTESGERYRLWYLPDLNNDELQQRGQAPIYYWIPNQVRLARRGDTGDYKFNLLHFVGVLSEDTNVGVEGQEEVAGGTLSLTTIAAPPLEALEQSHQQILDRFRGESDHYWGWRTEAAPRFQPVPIGSSMTGISNLSPNSDGTIPGVPAPGDGSGQPGSNNGNNGNGNNDGGTPAPPRAGMNRQLIRPRLATMPQTVPRNRAARSNNLDAWHWQLYGEGAGSLDPAGENAFSGMIGSLPTAILWQGFRGTYSPIVVSNAMTLRVWSPTMTLHIEGNWERIFEHFSANAEGRAWWFSADIQVELNKMIIDGTIEVDLQLDETVPTSGNPREEANQRPMKQSRRAGSTPVKSWACNASAKCQPRMVIVRKGRPRQTAAVAPAHRLPHAPNRVRRAVEAPWAATASPNHSGPPRPHHPAASDRPTRSAPNRVPPTASVNNLSLTPSAGRPSDR